MPRPFLAEWRDALLNSDLDRTARLVGLVLSTFAKAGGSCYPSKARLAADSRLSVRAVDGAVDRLEAAGLLTVSRSRGRSSNGYQLTAPTPQVAARLVEANPAGNDSQPRRKRRLTPQVAAGESAESAESVTAGDDALSARLPSACPECELEHGRHADGCKKAA